MRQLTIRRPDDWHLHLRDAAVMQAVLPHSSSWCGRAIIMPNLIPPITTSEMADKYRQRILGALPEMHNFIPLMVLYLTEATTPEEVRKGVSAGILTAIKLYPAGATTNSDSGVRNIEKVMPVLEVMAAIGLPLLIHGEVTESDIDIFDREAVFIDRVLLPLRKRLPELRIVFEHITTRQAAEFVLAGDNNLGATITPHHLLINRNAILAGGIKSHYYCLPVAKRESHRLALLETVLADTGKVFLGTDSAPHIDSAKLQPCGCAGIFNAPNALVCLAQLFESHDALDRLENFTSVYGPEFYRLPVNSDRITLIRHDTAQPTLPPLATEEGPITVFDPQIEIFWSIADEHLTRRSLYKDERV